MYDMLCGKVINIVIREFNLNLNLNLFVHG